MQLDGGAEAPQPPEAEGGAAGGGGGARRGVPAVVAVLALTPLLIIGLLASFAWSNIWDRRGNYKGHGRRRREREAAQAAALAAAAGDGGPAAAPAADQELEERGEKDE